MLGLDTESGRGCGVIEASGGAAGAELTQESAGASADTRAAEPVRLYQQWGQPECLLATHHISAVAAANVR